MTIKSASEVLPRIASQCTDMAGHFTTLTALASQCQSVIEMGVRGGCSAFALLAGLEQSQWAGKWMLYLDINDCQNKELEEIAHQHAIEIEFKKADSRYVDLPECDLLFIDTLHTYGQLSLELQLHSSKARKYIVMHDVEAPYGTKNEIKDGSPKEGLQPAIQDFLAEFTNWRIKDWHENCHGLCVLERTNEL